VLIIIPKRRICVTQRAVFGFHAARAIDQYSREYPAPEATRVVAASYSAADPQLDQATWRPDANAHFSQRTRAGG
jgi:hypothetical protein